MQPGNILEDIRARVELWVEVCKDGTAECVDILLDIWERFLKALSSFFKTSNKSDGLFAEL